MSYGDVVVAPDGHTDSVVIHEPDVWPGLIGVLVDATDSKEHWKLDIVDVGAKGSWPHVGRIKLIVARVIVMILKIGISTLASTSMAVMTPCVSGRRRQGSCPLHLGPGTIKQG